jgi:hypothetical protein
MFFWESFGGAHFFRLVGGQRELCATLWFTLWRLCWCFVCFVKTLWRQEREREREREQDS